MSDYKFLVLIIPLLLWQCGSPTDSGQNQFQIPNLNQPDQVEVVTWNLKFFPQSGGTTVDSLEKLMKAVNADIYCLQEIDNRNSLTNLVNRLDNYEVIISQEMDYNLRLAIVYRTTDFILRDSRELFLHEDDAFVGRFPLRADFTFNWAEEFDFTVINIHLKCCGDPEDLDTRREAAGILHTYLDSLQFTSRDTNIIVVGDWNNDLDNMTQSHPFNVFWADSDQYRFLTYELAAGDNSYDASYPGWSPPSFLDHILIAKPLFDEARNGQVQTLRLDDYMNNYITLVSDHRPVAWEFTP